MLRKPGRQVWPPARLPRDAGADGRRRRGLGSGGELPLAASAAGRHQRGRRRHPPGGHHALDGAPAAVGQGLLHGPHARLLRVRPRPGGGDLHGPAQHGGHVAHLPAGAGRAGCAAAPGLESRAREPRVPPPVRQGGAGSAGAGGDLPGQRPAQGPGPQAAGARRQGCGAKDRRPAPLRHASRGLPDGPVRTALGLHHDCQRL
mmetsp:Transcript_28825/g.82566  ORF Transcript_28825/g.82566 Transcript_28825/m.82566 type:complete len:203 (+) Transcript_28825:377-985(+)